MRVAVAIAMAVAFAGPSAHAQDGDAPLARYRHRLLGVYNSQTGEAIEGADVIDVLNKNKSLTSATGTVTLAFLPDGESMVRIQKIGFTPEMNIVTISPTDTLPVTVLLTPLGVTLPTVVTKEVARKYTSPGLRDFEERRLRGNGKFIGEDLLRKNDSRTMTNLIRQIGVPIACDRRFQCFAVSMRQTPGSGTGVSSCSYDVYLDGMRITDERRDLEKIFVNEIGGVEAYRGLGEIPSQYNMTGSACGVLLFWSRER